MLAPSRIFLAATAIACAVGLCRADLPKDSPFAANGPAGTPSLQNEPLEFAGVSTVGQKTMINLFDRQQKHSLWVQVGQTSDGVTVVSYDSAHDQVKVRQNGVEKTLPLRAQSTVSGPAVAVPIMAPPPAAPEPAAAAPTPTASTATDSTPATPQTRARQEEEARMLVSDLLEIGIAQRKAYEDAQKRLANGQPAQPAPPSTATSGQPNQPAAAASAPAQ